MKKIILGLFVLVGSVLLLMQYLVNIGLVATDKINSNAVTQLTATDSKPTPPATNTKAPAVVPPVVKQLADTTEPLNKQLAEKVQQINNALPKLSSKASIATIKIYDKKTAKEINIDTPSMLTARQQTVTPQQQEEQQQKAIKFKTYYQKPEKCLSPSSQEIRIECGNEYIRAKAKFEELWQQGKFKQ